MRLTIEAFAGGAWGRTGELELVAPEDGPGGACHFEYDLSWVARWIAENAPYASVSLTFPVQAGPLSSPRWPAFLDDLRPMGSAHRWWLKRLGLPSAPASETEALRRGTIAPIGNLRIAEAVPPKQEPPLRFRRRALIERQSDFLQWAAEHGAQVGGATGAGGESPKVLVRCDASDQVWIDVWQDEPESPDRHYLVKFARGGTERDRVVLRSEHVYYRALAELGVDTISTEGMALEEGPGGPSLWLPRFDVARPDGRTVLHGMESMYSLVGAEPGAWITHQQVLRALREVVARERWPDTVLEYLRRDLLNLVFGNSDNHGRNTAVLRTEGEVRLSPVFDFAPMKMDLEGVTRTTRWERLERGGEVDWPALLSSFEDEDVPEEFLREGLRALGQRLRDLDERLEALGLPEETLHFPALDLAGTERKLRAWTIL